MWFGLQLFLEMWIRIQGLHLQSSSNKCDGQSWCRMHIQAFMLHRITQGNVKLSQDAWHLNPVSGDTWEQVVPPREPQNPWKVELGSCLWEIYPALELWGSLVKLSWFRAMST